MYWNMPWSRPRAVRDARTTARATQKNGGMASVSGTSVDRTNRANLRRGLRFRGGEGSFPSSFRVLNIQASSRYSNCPGGTAQTLTGGRFDFYVQTCPQFHL